MLLSEITPPPQFSVRLIGGATEYEGRVEYYYNGEWGTVCDASWDINDAMVVCRQLHFTGANEALNLAPFGAGTGPIWLDDILCTGSEKALSECPHDSSGNNSCSHNQDAGVRCTGTEVYTNFIQLGPVSNFSFSFNYWYLHTYVATCFITKITIIIITKTTLL